MEPREIAARVLELLGPNGERWQQDSRSLCCRDFHCIVTAAQEEVAPSDYIAQDAFYAAVERMLGVEPTTAKSAKRATIDFNDGSATTFADVRRVLTQIASEP